MKNHNSDIDVMVPNSCPPERTAWIEPSVRILGNLGLGLLAF